MLSATDERALPAFGRWNTTDRVNQSPWTAGRLWSSSVFCGGSSGWAIGQDQTSSGCFDTMPLDESGGAQIKKIIGVTRDGSANALGSCVVMGFVTATNTFIGQVTSDMGGYYELPTTYSGSNHFLVVYKAGSPDIAGTTLNTLTGV